MSFSLHKKNVETHFVRFQVVMSGFKIYGTSIKPSCFVRIKSVWKHLTQTIKYIRCSTYHNSTPFPTINWSAFYKESEILFSNREKWQIYLSVPPLVQVQCIWSSTMYWNFTKMPTYLYFHSMMFCLFFSIGRMEIFLLHCPTLWYLFTKFQLLSHFSGMK